MLWALDPGWNLIQSSLNCYSIIADEIKSQVSIHVQIVFCVTNHLLLEEKCRGKKQSGTTLLYKNGKFFKEREGYMCLVFSKSSLHSITIKYSTFAFIAMATESMAWILFLYL